MGFRNVFLCIFITVMVLGSPAGAADLSEATRVHCFFCSGTSVDWYQKKPEPLIIRKEFVDKLCPSVIFAAIDRESGTAISKEGDLKSVVSVWESPRTLSFVGMSYGGDAVITTVYRQEAMERNMFLSVRSDHTFQLQFPVPTQFFGACEVFDEGEVPQ